jgi:hypothetical protein
MPAPPPPPTRIPRPTAGARFLGAEELHGRPCIAVDGMPPPSAVLAIAHWPQAGAPEWLLADTATEMADRYLRLDPAGPEVPAVVNDHVDADGMLAAWMVLHAPAAGASARALAIAAAEAGDFGTWTEPAAAWVAIALMALAEPSSSPIPAVRTAFSPQSAREPVGRLVRAVLPRVARLLDDPEAYRGLWRPRWERVLADLALLESGAARLEDHPDLDLVVVRSPRTLDELALHPLARRGRVLMWPDGEPPALTHRYETWVAFSSAGFAPRQPLDAAAERLSALEPAPGVRWRADHPSVARARLRPVDAEGTPAPSALTAAHVVAELRVAASSAERAGNLPDVGDTHRAGRTRPGR